MAEKKRYFVENIWYAAAWEYEVADADNKLARTICDTPLVFYKGDAENYVALDDRCCHRAAPLSIGRVEGNCIRCMYHGMLYDEKGQVIEIPGQDHISKSLKVRSYPVVAKGGMIWIWMGDKELANEKDIYDFPPLSDKENWRGFDKEAYLHYERSTKMAFRWNAGTAKVTHRLFIPRSSPKVSTAKNLIAPILLA